MNNIQKHNCHAYRCLSTCKPEWLMCPRHWRMVPPEIKKRVLDAYVTGQCNLTPKPSDAWHKAADDAIFAVCNIEKRALDEFQGALF